MSETMITARRKALLATNLIEVLTASGYGENFKMWDGQVYTFGKS